MSRLSRRRSNRALEVGAVVVILLGLVLVETVALGADVNSFVAAVNQSPAFLITLAFPAGIASFVAVVKLR